MKSKQIFNGIALAFIVAVATVLLWPVYVSPRPSGQPTTRVTAAKVLAISLIQYASDNDRNLPTKIPKSWLDQFGSSQFSSIQYNQNLAGSQLPASADQAEELILVYDMVEVSKDRFALVDGAGRSRLVSGEVWRSQILPTLRH